MTLYARDFCQSLDADLPTVADEGVDKLLYYVLGRASVMVTCCRCCMTFLVAAAAAEVAVAVVGFINDKQDTRRAHTSAKANQAWIRSPYDYFQNLIGTSFSKDTSMTKF